MRKSTLCQAQKVKFAVLNEPHLIPLYFKPPYNPKLTQYILYKMLNRSCGIEIECFGSLSDTELKEYDRFFIQEYYNIKDYGEETL